jgi:MOSC domain-containing protein YiiM
VSHLVGRRFRVGEAVLRGIKINAPCQHLEDVVGKRLLSALVHRYGLNAEVVESGRIRPGDAVETLDTH